MHGSRGREVEGLEEMVVSGGVKRTAYDTQCCECATVVVQKVDYKIRHFWRDALWRRVGSYHGDHSNSFAQGFPQSNKVSRNTNSIRIDKQYESKPNRLTI